MIVAIVGARTRNSHEDYLLVENAFLNLQSPDAKIISGGAKKGGDKFAKRIAEKYGVEFDDKSYTPDFSNGYNPWLYRERNDRIAKDADILIACVDPMTVTHQTGGTNYTIRKFKEYHPKAEVIIV